MLKPLFYGVLAFPVSVMSITYYVVLPKWYAENLSLDVATLGLYIALARIWDGISDPAVGFLTDKLTRSGGNLKLLVALGVLLCAGSFCLLVAPSLVPFLNPLLSFIIFSFLFYLGLTFVSVPYEALGVLSRKESSERSSFLAIRDGMFILGTVGAFAIPVLLYGKETTSDLFELGIIYSVILILSYLLILFFFHPEGSTATTEEETSSIDGLKVVWRNRDFKFLLLSFVVASFGAGLPASLFLFFCETVLGFSEYQAFQSLLLYFFIGLGLMPVWTYVSNRYAKKTVWFTSLCIHAGFFLPVVFLSEGQGNIFLILISLSAVGFGGTIVLPSFIQADLVRNVSSQTSISTEGIFMGIWALAKKFAQALGAGIGLLVLGWVGFSPNVEANDDIRLTMSLLYAVVPAVTALISILLALPLQQGAKKPNEINL